MDYNSTSNLNTNLNLEYVGVDGTVNMSGTPSAYASDLGTITTDYLTYTSPYSYSISNVSEIKIHHNDPWPGWWRVDLNDDTDDKLDDIDDTENGVLDDFINQFARGGNK